MKKILLSLVLLCSTSFVYAADVFKISYKNIEDESKIKIQDNSWLDKVNRKDTEYFLKIVTEDNYNKYSNFYNPDGSFTFSTDCQYEFIKDGELIGYSNTDLKFYKFTYENNNLNKEVLTQDEIQIIFPNYRIIKISEFSPNTNSLKIKKEGRNLKIILLNDTDRIFDNYSFTTGNANFEQSEMIGIINVKQKGMFHFSKFGDNTKDTPWFILLVR